MKVLLVWPPLPNLPGVKNATSLAARKCLVEPLALEYVASGVKDFCDVRLLDMRLEKGFDGLQETLAKFQPDNPFTLSSGMKSPWYFDVKSALMFQRTKEYIETLLHYVLEYSERTCPRPDVVGGPANAAYLLVPMARSVERRFVMRKAEKGHGIVGKIDGWAPKEGESVALVEDVITTGGSLLPVIKYVEEQCKAHVEKIIVVVDRNENDQLGKYRDRIQALTTKEDYLDQILPYKKIEEGDLAEIKIGQ